MNLFMQFVRKLSLEFLIAVFVIILCSLLGFLFQSHILNSSYQNQKYRIDTTNSVDYQVFLNDNDFIDSPYLGKDQSYVSSMINFISISFSQNVELQKIDSFNYSYTIYARLSTFYKDDTGSDTEVWNKIYPLKIQNNLSANSSSFVIHEQVNLSYQDYQAIVSSFKQNYQLNVDAKLDVIMDINYIYDQYSSKNTKLTLTVPMNQDVFEITSDYDKSISFSETETISIMTMSPSLVLLILILLGMITLLLLLVIIFKVLSVPSKSNYERLKTKIKKDYGSIIVDVDNKIDFSKFTIFEIKTIEELVDLEEEIRIPILFYEKEKLGVCYFVIIKDKYMYRYTLEDLEREKHNEKKKKQEN